MAQHSAVLTSSSAWTASGVHVQQVELIPDGGTVEIRVLQGTDSTGTEKYRLKAMEKGEHRKFNNLLIPGPIYVYFYSGSGALVVVTEEEI